MQQWTMEELFEEHFHQGTVAKLIALRESCTSIVTCAEIIYC